MSLIAYKNIGQTYPDIIVDILYMQCSLFSCFNQLPYKIKPFNYYCYTSYNLQQLMELTYYACIHLSLRIYMNDYIIRPA